LTKKKKKQASTVYVNAASIKHQHESGEFEVAFFRYLVEVS